MLLAFVFNFPGLQYSFYQSFIISYPNTCDGSHQALSLHSTSVGSPQHYISESSKISNGSLLYPRPSTSWCHTHIWNSLVFSIWTCAKANWLLLLCLLNIALSCLPAFFSQLCVIQIFLMFLSSDQLLPSLSTASSLLFSLLLPSRPPQPAVHTSAFHLSCTWPALFLWLLNFYT